MNAAQRLPVRRRTSRIVAMTAGITLAIAAPAAAVAAHRQGGAGPAAPRAVAGSVPADSSWPITECGTYSGTGCAPTSARVDLTKPTFSHPTRITNPLFPVSRTRAVVQTGVAGGQAFRSETTLLPQTGTVEWEGKEIEVVLAQYLAFRGGQIEEIALDRYAQADDGAVWYLGEDVFDYEAGTITVGEGTWLAGRDGPPAMIMPANPRVGDVFRAENIIGVVFEEIRVTGVGRTVQGPTGPISGAISVSELRLDGTFSKKTFAPGYGEFRTEDDADIEALAVAAPADAVRASLPVPLRSLTTSAWGIIENARVGDWDGATATLARMTRHWTAVRAIGQPPLVVQRMTRALAALRGAVKAQRAVPTEQAGIEVAQAALDLQLRYLPVDRVDVERVHLHAQQLRVHAAAGNRAATTGEVAAIEWTSSRLPLPASVRGRLDVGVRDLRLAADTGNLPATADHAARLASSLRIAT
jgi:hypothetical protein